MEKSLEDLFDFVDDYSPKVPQTEEAEDNPRKDSASSSFWTPNQVFVKKDLLDLEMMNWPETFQCKDCPQTFA